VPIVPRVTVRQCAYIKT